MLKKINKLSDFKNINFDFPEKKDIFSLLAKFIDSDSIITLWISWWPDSMFVSVLLYIFFLENNFPIKNLNFVHCNHKIRKESEQEQNFIEQFFKWFNLDVFLRDSSAFSNHQKNKKIDFSISASEWHLRKRRYECFESVVEKCQSQKKDSQSILVLWHNLTDRIETTFLNMCRWASLNWFIWMNFIESKKKNSNYNILRPVLWLSKKYIENLCKKFFIPYVVDLSNFDSKTSKRNYLRNEILPLIYKMSNRQNDDTNSFVESFKKVYWEIENLTPNPLSTNVGSPHRLLADISNPPSSRLGEGGLNLQPIKLSKYWKTKWWYELKINREKIQIKDIVLMLKELKIYSDIGTNFLNELLSFLKTKNDWYKYFNWTYFFVSHSKIYIINWPKLFWERVIDEEMEVKKLWKIKFWDFEIDIKDKNQIWSIIRFSKPKDIYKWKNLNKYLLNKKIPIFWRNYRPVIVKDKLIIEII